MTGCFYFEWYVLEPKRPTVVQVCNNSRIRAEPGCRWVRVTRLREDDTVAVRRSCLILRKYLTNVHAFLKCRALNLRLEDARGGLSRDGD